MIRAKEHGPFPNAPNPFHLQAFFAHRYIVGSFVCAKIRNNNVCNVGKSKSLAAVGAPATAGLPDTGRPGFPRNRTRDAFALVRETRFRKKMSNFSLALAVPENMARFLLALGAREFVGGRLVERAINKQERCRE